MLQSIRNKSKNWAWIIVFLLSVPFALWGIERFNFSEVDEIIGNVGERNITRSNYTRAFLSEQSRLQERLGDSYVSRVDEDQLKKQVFQRVFVNSMFDAGAKNMGFYVSDAMLAKAIASQEGFQDADGQFDAEKYTSFLQLNGFTPKQFEKELRWSDRTSQMYSALLDSNFVADYEAKEIFSINTHEREFAWMVLPWENFADKVSVSEDEILNFYDQNPNNFTIPERMKIAYISLSIDDLSAAVEINDDALRTYYDNNSTDFSTEEERDSSHILFGPGSLAVAETVLAELKADGDFAALAKQHSIDTVSAEEGGQLGAFGRGIMVAPFEEALFSLTEGAYSDIVETQFGYHIIRLNKIIPATTQSFEEVKLEVTEAYRYNEALRRYFELQETLATLSFENPTSLEAAASALDLTVQTSDWFTQANGEGFTASNMVRQAAFTPQVKQEALNSNVLDISEGNSAVIRQLEVEPERLQPLSEVSERITKRLTQQKASQMLKEDVQVDLAKIRANTLTWADFTKRYQREFGNAAFNWYGQQPQENQQLQKIFKLVFERPRPYSASKVDYQMGSTSLDDVLVFALRGSREANPKTLEVDANQVKDLLSNFQRQNDRVTLLEYLQDQYDAGRIDFSDYNL